MEHESDPYRYFGENGHCVYAASSFVRDLIFSSAETYCLLEVNELRFIRHRWATEKIKSQVLENILTAQAC